MYSNVRRSSASVFARGHDRDRRSLHGVEAPDLVDAEHVIGVGVREQDGVHAAHVVGERLRAQIGGGVDEHEPHGGGDSPGRRPAGLVTGVSARADVDQD